jgi:putative pyruvate formate lyase activating enzyme
MSEFLPAAYLTSQKNGTLKQKVLLAYQQLSACNLCAWECGIDRTAGEKGVCRIGLKAKISSYGPHFGEEKPLSGWRGSGTIFFTSCNMHCQYCQNADISQSEYGQEVDPEELAAIMLELQASGCHNINFVSPSHVIAQILAAVLIAAQAGLNLPLVYNTGGYDSMNALALLDGVFDIYMPDMKYASPQVGLHYSKVRNYPAINQAALVEMHRQVGDLQIDQQGLAKRGLLVRHLILPNGLAGTQTIVQFLAQTISRHTYLNLMDQYRPTYNASRFPKLNRRIKNQEYEIAIRMAIEAGLNRLDKQVE